VNRVYWNPEGMFFVDSAGGGTRAALEAAILPTALDPVRARVAKLRLRLARNLLLDALLRALFWAGAAFSPLLIAHRALSPGFDALWMAAGLGVLALAAAAVRSALRFPSLPAAATEADRELRLKEQFSSALLLEDRWGPGPFADPVAEAFRLRAESAASQLRLEGTFRFRPPREAKALPVALCAAVLLYLAVPEWDLLGFLARRKAREENKSLVADAARDLENRTRRLGERAQGLEGETARQIVADLEQVAQMLHKPAGDRKEALAEISELSRKIRDLRKDAEKNDLRNAFRPAAGSEGGQEDLELAQAVREAMKQGGAKEAAKELLGQLKSLDDAFAKGGLKAEDLAKMARKLDQLTRRFNLPPELARKAQELSRSLKSLAERGGKEYSAPPPELAFTEEELIGLLKNLETQEFLEYAEREVEAARQQMTKTVKLCPYCQKGLKHPEEGGTPLPGFHPENEEGTAYI
jgi:hypothetical protein